MCDGICFLDLSSTAHPTINLLDFASGRIRNLGTLDKPVDWGYSGLSVSADAKGIIYAQMDDLISQLMLVKNFHGSELRASRVRSPRDAGRSNARHGW